jgi:hypothetical protein
MFAALLCLTSVNVKHLARRVGISYGVVRVWRSRADFKGLIDQLEQEFVKHFFVEIDRAWSQPVKEFSLKQLAELDSETIRKAGPWARLKPLLSDARQYAPRLVTAILRGTPSFSERLARSWTELDPYISALEMLYEARGEGFLNRELVERFATRTEAMMWESVAKTLAAPRLSPEMRRAALMNLRILQRRGEQLQRFIDARRPKQGRR